MDKPLISVIVPVYNREQFLDRCIKSICGQSYANLEIILVNDGSTDNSLSICEQWKKDDPRIFVINQANMGVVAARSNGVVASKGEYLAFVDSDDWLEMDCYEYLYQLISKYNVEVACANVANVSSQDEIIENPVEEVHLYEFEGIIKNMNNNLSYLHEKLYKRSLFDNVPEIPTDMFLGEDTLINYFIYKQCDRIAVSNQIKYYYFRHPDAGIAGAITYGLINSSLTAYRIIDDDFDKTLPAYQYQLYNKMLSGFFLLNSVIRNQLCLDKYDELRRDIIDSYKKITDNKIISKKHLYAVNLLMKSKTLYNKSILLRTKMRGY